MSEGDHSLSAFKVSQEVGYRTRESFRGQMREALCRVIEQSDDSTTLGRFRFAYEYRRATYPGLPEAENMPGQSPEDHDGLRVALERALSLALFDNLDKSDDPDLTGVAPIDERFKQELTAAAEAVVTDRPWRQDMLRMGTYLDALRQHGINSTNGDELSALIVKGLNRYCDRACEPEQTATWRI